MKRVEQQCVSGHIGALLALGVLVALAASVSCSRTQTADAKTGQVRLEIPGTGACEECLGHLATAFNRAHPGLTVEVPPSVGSRGGIKAAGDGRAVLGRVARKINDSETGLGLSYLPFAKDAVVFAVGEKVEVTDLTPAQLADIFSGKTANWQQVGGNEAPVRVLYREEGDSSLSAIQESLAPFASLTFAPQGKCAYHDHEMISLLNKFPTSIGFATNSCLAKPDNQARPIAVDGAAPTSENVRSGRYQLVCEYALVYKQAKLNDLAKEFIDFIFSDAGKQILAEHGIVPLPRP